MLVVACQPSPPSVKTAGSRLPTQVTPTINLERRDEPDIVGTLIDQVEEKQIKQEVEAASVAIRPASPLAC